MERHRIAKLPIRTQLMSQACSRHPTVESCVITALERLEGLWPRVVLAAPSSDGPLSRTADGGGGAVIAAMHDESITISSDGSGPSTARIQLASRWWSLQQEGEAYGPEETEETLGVQTACGPPVVVGTADGTPVNQGHCCGRDAASYTPLDGVMGCLSQMLRSVLHSPGGDGDDTDVAAHRSGSVVWALKCIQGSHWYDVSCLALLCESTELVVRLEACSDTDTDAVDFPGGTAAVHSSSASSPPRVPPCVLDCVSVRLMPDDDAVDLVDGCHCVDNRADVDASLPWRVTRCAGEGPPTRRGRACLRRCRIATELVLTRIFHNTPVRWAVAAGPLLPHPYVNDNAVYRRRDANVLLRLSTYMCCAALLRGLNSSCWCPPSGPCGCHKGTGHAAECAGCMVLQTSREGCHRHVDDVDHGVDGARLRLVLRGAFAAGVPPPWVASLLSQLYCFRDTLLYRAVGSTHHKRSRPEGGGYHRAVVVEQAAACDYGVVLDVYLVRPQVPPVATGKVDAEHAQQLRVPGWNPGLVVIARHDQGQNNYVLLPSTHGAYPTVERWARTMRCGDVVALVVVHHVALTYRIAILRRVLEGHLVNAPPDTTTSSTALPLLATLLSQHVPAGDCRRGTEEGDVAGAGGGGCITTLAVLSSATLSHLPRGHGSSLRAHTLLHNASVRGDHRTSTLAATADTARVRTTLVPLRRVTATATATTVPTADLRLRLPELSAEQWNHRSMREEGGTHVLPIVVPGACDLLFEETWRRILLDTMRVVAVWDTKFILLVSDDPQETRGAGDGQRFLLADQHALHERTRLEFFISNFPSYLTSTAPRTVFYVPPCLAMGVDRHWQVLHALGWALRRDADDVTLVTGVPQLTIEGFVFAYDAMGPLETTVEELDAVGGGSAGHDDGRDDASSVCRRQDGGATGPAMIPSVMLTSLISRSCRGAIMFGDVLSTEEAEMLVKCSARRVSKFLQCSHGRPSFAQVDTR